MFGVAAFTVARLALQRSRFCDGGCSESSGPNDSPECYSRGCDQERSIILVVTTELMSMVTLSFIAVVHCRVACNLFSLKLPATPTLAVAFSAGYKEWPPSPSPGWPCSGPGSATEAALSRLARTTPQNATLAVATQKGASYWLL